MKLTAEGSDKLSLNVKNGIIEEALVETIGCSGMTHSAAMAAEILQGKPIKKIMEIFPKMERKRKEQVF